MVSPRALTDPRKGHTPQSFFPPLLLFLFVCLFVCLFVFFVFSFQTKGYYFTEFTLLENNIDRSVAENVTFSIPVI